MIHNKLPVVDADCLRDKKIHKLPVVYADGLRNKKMCRLPDPVPHSIELPMSFKN